jgi:hypothetical protein
MKKAIVLFIVVFSSVVGVIVIVRHHSPSNQPYAYATPYELVVMRGTKVVKRVRHSFDDSNIRNGEVLWTRKGDYLVFLASAADGSNESMSYINVRTGALNSISCPRCEGFVALDGNNVLAFAEQDVNGKDLRKLIKFNLDTRRPIAQSNDGRFVEGAPEGSTLESAFTSQVRYKNTTNEPIRRLTFIRVSDYRIFQFVVYRTSGLVMSAPVGGVLTRHQKIAVAHDSNNTNACKGLGTLVSIVDPDEQTSKNTNLAPIEHGGFKLDGEGGMTVNDLWWDTDGYLHATFETWSCRGGKKVIIEPSAPWRLSGKRNYIWVKEKAKRATTARRLDANTRISLVKPDCPGDAPPEDSPKVDCDKGDLFLDQGKRQTRLNDQTLWIYAPPSKATAGPELPSPAKTSSFADENPIINDLPYENLIYSIGYRIDPSDPSHNSIILTIDAPEGTRNAAVQQIRDMGYDPTEYKIEFKDYKNPFGS